MKNTFLTLLLCILSIYGFSQDIKETNFNSQIEEVTVFLSGAQIFETSSGQLKPENHSS
jgi:hypothetical protein